MNIKKDIRFRVYVAFTAMCLLGLAILGKAVWMQVKEGPELRDRAKQALTRNATLPAERGNIYTEDGQLLCSSIPQFDIRVDFTVIQKDTFYKRVDELAGMLSAMFKDKSAAAYRSELIKGFKDKERYYLLKRNLAYYDFLELRNFPIFNKGKRRGGIIAESRTKRINPYGMLAYRSIGLYRSNAQTIGLEATCDSILKGMDGRRIDQKATGGVWMPVDGSVVDPENGKDVVTTIDIGIQEVAEHAMMAVLKQYGCAYGTVVVMEVQTGKVRAIVNLGRQKDGSYFEDYNYALLPAEPGSTFKMATLLSLLNDKYITVNDMISDEGGQKQFGPRTMHDSHHGYGLMPIRKAFAVSSNVCMASLATKYYAADPKKYIAHIKKLHLNEKTHIGLQGEQKPYMIEPGEPQWSGTTLPWMATGYGIMITPLHTCMLYNAVANGGKMMKPYLISAVKEYGKEVRVIKPTVLEEAIASPEAIKQVQSCAEEVVLSGTGKAIKSPFYSIAGKTGTAQVADQGISYKDRVYQGSFVGYFPADKPRYTIAVVVRTQKGAGSYYGGTLAAPVFRMITDKIFASTIGQWNEPLDSIAKVAKVKLAPHHLASASTYQFLLASIGQNAVSASHEKGLATIETDSSNRIIIKNKEVVRGIVPDVKGLALKDAVYLLENEGLRVEIQGRGIVQGQSIPAGSKINKNQLIVLQLS